MPCKSASLSSFARGALPAADDGRLPLPSSPTLSEVFPETAVDGAAPAFVLAALSAARAASDNRGPVGPILWIQDRLSLKETGRPYLAGSALSSPGTAAPDMLHLTVGRVADVLWAMEQGLGCPALSAVVGEVWGEARALDFTATKRLALRAEAHAVPAWLIRRAGLRDLSAARMRWTVASAPSERLEDDPRAPGMPRWTVRLFRARGLRPGDWTVRHDPSRHSLDFTSSPSRDGMDVSFATASGGDVSPLQAQG